MQTKKPGPASGWVDPDDAPVLTREWFERADLHQGDKIVRRGRPKSDNPKEAVNLRLGCRAVVSRTSPDVKRAEAWLKAHGASLHRFEAEQDHSKGAVLSSHPAALRHLPPEGEGPSPAGRGTAAERQGEGCWRGLVGRPRPAMRAIGAAAQARTLRGFPRPPRSFAPASRTGARGPAGATGGGRRP